MHITLFCGGTVSGSWLLDVVHLERMKRGKFVFPAGPGFPKQDLGGGRPGGDIREVSRGGEKGRKCGRIRAPYRGEFSCGREGPAHNPTGEPQKDISG